MDQFWVSIIVPVYNVESFLDNCIESVFDQTYPFWELILIDDGSTDRSGEICDKYANRDERIKVIHKINGGLSSARNAGLDIALGQYISFLDSDDFWHNKFLETLLNIAIENKADIAQCNYMRGRESKFPTVRINSRIKIFDNKTIFLSNNAKIIVCAKLYKFSLFDGVRMPLGKLNEDDYTTWKLYYKSKRIVVTNLMLYYYTINDKSIMGNLKKNVSVDYIDAYIERIQFFQEKREIALEDNTRAHLCKSMILLGSNQNLTNDQRETAGITFNQNWKKIHKSKYVPYKLRCLFFAYQIFPGFVHMIIRHVRGI